MEFRFKPNGKDYNKCTKCVSKRKKTWKKPERDIYDWTNPKFCKRMADQHEKMLRYKFGINTQEEFHMYSSQNGCCAICGAKTKLFVDHCHETGKVRGLLCKSCNGGIGFMRESTRAMRAAIDYIENYRINPGPVEVLRASQANPQPA